jgi:predicted dehydrogenase
MQKIRLGVIGGGYMGKAHAIAAHSVSAVMELDTAVELGGIAAGSPESAARYAAMFKAPRSFGSAQALIESDEIDAVVIASPQNTHLEFVKLCAAAGKPVMCEKPMGRTLAEAQAIAAAAKPVVNLVAYNYINTPASAYARKLIADGAIGEITWFRGEHNEDFMVEPLDSWRLYGDANGTLGDLAPHVIQCALAFCGPIDSLVADIKCRPESRRQSKSSNSNDDQIQFMCQFSSGANGFISSSRVAHGRKMGYAYEIHGTEGTIRFDQEDQNCLWLYQRDSGPNAGFQRILAGPAHGDYRFFCQGPAHGTGYQDQIIIEQANFFRAILGQQPAWPSFNDGAEVMRVVEAVRDSHKQSGWVSLSEQR